MLISFSMDFTIVCISMTSSTNIGGGGEFFCICWLVGESATSMESFVDSSIEYLLYMVTPLIDCSFWFAFVFVLVVFSLRILVFLLSIVRMDIMLFCHEGGSAVQLWFCSREPGRDSWAIIELVNSSWITSREAEAMIRVEIRSVGIFFTNKIENTWIMSVSIHYQRMGNTRSRRHRARSYQ